MKPSDEGMNSLSVTDEERVAKLIHDHVYALSQTISGREQEWAALARDNLTKRNCFDCAIEICGAASRVPSESPDTEQKP